MGKALTEQVMNFISKLNTREPWQYAKKTIIGSLLLVWLQYHAPE